LLKQRAHKLETRKNPVRVKSIQTTAPLAQAVAAVTHLEGEELHALTAQIMQSPNPEVALFEACKGYAPPSVLNYIMASCSHEYFARYLPKHFDTEFSDRFHGKMWPAMMRVARSETLMPTLVAGWRECGKSTCWSTLLPIHCVVFPNIEYTEDGREINRAKEYVTYTSAIQGGAKKALMDVQMEFENNDAIRRDFGEFYLVNGHKPSLWNKTEFLTANGVYFDISSRRTSKRGLRMAHRRPDLPIVDDVEDTERAKRSFDARKNDLEWFSSEFIAGVDKRKGTPVMLGNYAYTGCLAQKLADIGKKRDWHILEFRVKEFDEEQGCEVYTWEKRFGPEFEKMEKNRLVFESSWQTEYQLNPSTGTDDLKEADFKGYDLEWFLRERLKFCRVYFACDPASGKKQKSDKTALVPIALDRATGIKYVLPIVHERGLDEYEIAKKYIDMYRHYMRHAALVARHGVESVAFQDALRGIIYKECLREGLTINPEPIQQSGRGDKRLRIRRTWKGIKQGHILFLLDDEGHVEMIQQIFNEDSDHDDAADAFEMADRLTCTEDAANAKKKARGVRIKTVTKGKIHEVRSKEKKAI